MSYTTAELKQKLNQIDVQNENQHNHLHADREVAQFKATHAYNKITTYIQSLNNSVVDLTIPTTYDTTVHSTIWYTVQLLESIEHIFDQYTPETQHKPTIEHNTATATVRFGNPLYRTALNDVQSHSTALITQLFKQCNVEYTNEQIHACKQYLDNSFGNIQRIDYGTGHELNFICLLYVFTELQLYTVEQYKYVVLVIFHKYIQLMRKLQIRYLLEPAGSRGVWGLDDYNFLVFYFGSAQLLSHKHIKPKSSRQSDIIELYKDKYMYLDSIAYIMSVKTASFAEHSPLLNDITICKTWPQVNTGLYKMYVGEVLSKYAVIQHFIYTTYLKDTIVCAIEPIKEHTHELPCCTDVIQFPSAVASKTAEQRKYIDIHT